MYPSMNCWISSFFYKFAFYTFVFNTFVFYNSKFLSLLFIQFTFYTFVFYTVCFLYCSLFKRSFFIIQNLSFLKIKTYTGIDTFFNNSPTLFDPRVPFTAVGVIIFLQDAGDRTRVTASAARCATNELHTFFNYLLICDV